MYKLISIYLAKLVNKALFLLVVAVLTTQIIYAKSNFLIWPIYPIIESQDKAAPVWLENIGDEASIVQIRVFKWSQNDNKDQYQNQQEKKYLPWLFVHVAQIAGWRGIGAGGSYPLFLWITMCIRVRKHEASERIRGLHANWR